MDDLIAKRDSHRRRTGPVGLLLGQAHICPVVSRKYGHRGGDGEVGGDQGAGMGGGDGLELDLVDVAGCGCAALKGRGRGRGHEGEKGSEEFRCHYRVD